MEDTAKAQTDAVRKTEQGQRQDRLKNAIEHLGHESNPVRLGGAYELFHLAQDTEELRQTVLDILCANIRRTTSERKYREANNSKPSAEVQSLLTLLFRQNHGVFVGLHINLQESWLNGADLREARLEKAVLIEAHLQGAILNKAKLQGAPLREACLQGASLNKAQLQGASLYKAHLQGAFLIKAQLQGSVLYSANLQEAVLHRAQLQGVGGEGLPFGHQIRAQVGNETDIFGAIFEGGMNQEDVHSLVKYLSDKEAKELRKKLRLHIGMPPSHQLPQDSRAITGSYTEEEAEEWIAEYEQAVSGISRDDS